LPCDLDGSEVDKARLSEMLKTLGLENWATLNYQKYPKTSKHKTSLPVSKKYRTENKHK
jgi:hypothetical protein